MLTIILQFVYIILYCYFKSNILRMEVNIDVNVSFPLDIKKYIRKNPFYRLQMTYQSANSPRTRKRSDILTGQLFITSHIFWKAFVRVTQNASQVIRARVSFACKSTSSHINRCNFFQFYLIGFFAALKMNWNCHTYPKWFFPKIS